MSIVVREYACMLQAIAIDARDMANEVALLWAQHTH